MIFSDPLGLDLPIAFRLCSLLIPTMTKIMGALIDTAKQRIACYKDSGAEFA